jgi:hypothetical protein
MQTQDLFVELLMIIIRHLIKSLKKKESCIKLVDRICHTEHITILSKEDGEPVQQEESRIF